MKDFSDTARIIAAYGCSRVRLVHEAGASDDRIEGRFALEGVQFDYLKTYPLILGGRNSPSLGDRDRLGRAINPEHCARRPDEVAGKQRHLPDTAARIE